MGLAPYGEPRYELLIREKLIDLKSDGSFRLDLSYFNYCQGLTMTSRRFERLFGGPPRRPESPIGQREMDLAASIQRVTEDVVLRAARHVHDRTGHEALCLAGGVALNCVANGRLLREGPFEQIWVQPAAGDAGGSWESPCSSGTNCWAIRVPRSARRPIGLAALAPGFRTAGIWTFSAPAGRSTGSTRTRTSCAAAWPSCSPAEKVVGWFQGRMEFGPRALGSRSILGDARSGRMQSLMNLKIKFRESFRPFAPAVLAERAAEYFDIRPGQESPYMLLTAAVRNEKRRPCGDPQADLSCRAVYPPGTRQRPSPAWRSSGNLAPSFRP